MAIKNNADQDFLTLALLTLGAELFVVFFPMKPTDGENVPE